MSIATRPGAPRRPDVCPTAAAPSWLDRALAPFADLGGAIRADIAASLMPMTQELGTALERMATLEERVHDLEARLAAAAAAALGLPIPTAQPGVEKEPAPEQTESVAASHPVVDGEVADRSQSHPQSVATTRTQGGAITAMGTASPRSGPHTTSTSSAAMETAAGSQTRGETLARRKETLARRKKPRHRPVPDDTIAVPVPAVPVAAMPVATMPVATPPAPEVSTPKAPVSTALVLPLMDAATAVASVPAVPAPDVVPSTGAPENTAVAEGLVNPEVRAVDAAVVSTSSEEEQTVRAQPTPRSKKPRGKQAQLPPDLPNELTVACEALVQSGVYPDIDALLIDALRRLVLAVPPPQPSG